MEEVLVLDQIRSLSEPESLIELCHAKEGRRAIAVLDGGCNGRHVVVCLFHCQRRCQGRCSVSGRRGDSQRRIRCSGNDPSVGRIRAHRINARVEAAFALVNLYVQLKWWLPQQSTSQTFGPCANHSLSPFAGKWDHHLLRVALDFVRWSRRRGESVVPTR